MKNNIEKENNEMLRNQIKEAQHHSSELKAVVSTSTQVEPWVVAKMERATTDLSDIAHYLDGRKDMKMATGGPIEKYNLKNKTKYWIYDGDNLEMAGTVSILPNNYIQIKDPKGFVYSLSLLEQKYKNLKFEIYEKFAKGGLTPSQEAKVGEVMHEFKEGKLHSGSKQGPVVTERKQAIAIALAEANAMKMKKGGKIVGYLKSKKPVYEETMHPSHSYFTPQEHKEAAKLLRKQVAKENPMLTKPLAELSEKYRNYSHSAREHELWAKTSIQRSKDFGTGSMYKNGGTTNDLIKYAPGGKIRNWPSFTIDKMENDFPYKLSKVNQILHKAAKNRNCIVKDFSLSSQTKKYDTFAMLVYIGNVILEDAGSSTVTSSGTYFSKKGLTISFFLRWEARETGGYSNVTINASKDTAGGMSIYKNRQVNNYSDISSYIALILDSNLPNTLKDDVYAQGGSMYKDGGNITQEQFEERTQRALKNLKYDGDKILVDGKQIGSYKLSDDRRAKYKFFYAFSVFPNVDSGKALTRKLAVKGLIQNAVAKGLLYNDEMSHGGCMYKDGGTIKPGMMAWKENKSYNVIRFDNDMKRWVLKSTTSGLEIMPKESELPSFDFMNSKMETGGGVNSRFSSCEKWWDSLSNDQRKKIIEDNDLQFATTNDFDGLTTRGESELKTVFNTMNKPKMKDGGPVEKYTVAGREVTIDKNGTNDQTKWTVTFKQTGKKVDYVEVVALIKPRPKLMENGGPVEGDLTNLSNLERYVNAHKAEIKANRKTYGFMSVAKITNPYDFSSLLGVDSRIFRNAEIPYYAKFVASLLK